MAGFVKITEASSLALHAISYLASYCKVKPCTARELAASFRVSEHHLAKVLQRMSREGLLTSTRGPRGGFALARPAEDISLLEVVEAVDGPYRAGTCLFDVPICRGDACILGDLLEKLNSLVLDYLRNTKVADVTGILPEYRPRQVGEGVAAGPGKGSDLKDAGGSRSE